MSRLRKCLDCGKRPKHRWCGAHGHKCDVGPLDSGDGVVVDTYGVHLCPRCGGYYSVEVGR